MTSRDPKILAQSVYTEATNGIALYNEGLITHSELVNSVLIAVGNSIDTILGYPVNSPAINEGVQAEGTNGGDQVGAEATKALLEFDRKQIKAPEVKERVLKVLNEVAPKMED